MVDLFELNPALDQRPLDGGRVRDRNVGVGVQRLHHRPHAAARNPRRNKGVRVVERQQASLQPDATPNQQLAQLQDSVLALVDSHKVRQVRPGGDQRVPALGVRLDACRGAQRDRDSRAGGPNGAQRSGARCRRERLLTVAVVGMQVQGPGTGVNGRTRLRGQLARRARQRGMHAITVERRLQQDGRPGGLGLARLAVEGSHCAPMLQRLVEVTQPPAQAGRRKEPRGHPPAAGIRCSSPPQGLGCWRPGSVLLRLCAGRPPASRVRVDAMAAIALDAGVVGPALAATIVEVVSFGGREVRDGRLVPARSAAHPVQLTSPDGDVLRTGSGASGELLAAWRASNADSVVAASTAAPSNPVVRAMLPALSALFRVPGVSRFAVGRIARIRLRAQEMPGEDANHGVNTTTSTSSHARPCLPP